MTLRMRISNSTVVKFNEKSDKHLVNMVLEAQERGTFVKYPKKRVTATTEKEK